VVGSWQQCRRWFGSLAPFFHFPLNQPLPQMSKKRNPLVRQLRNWYQRIVKSKKIYNRKKKYEDK
jgi:hypothetical protein